MANGSDPLVIGIIAVVILISILDIFLVAIGVVPVAGDLLHGFGNLGLEALTIAGALIIGVKEIAK